MAPSRQHKFYATLAAYKLLTVCITDILTCCPKIFFTDHCTRIHCELVNNYNCGYWVCTFNLSTFHIVCCSAAILLVANAILLMTNAILLTNAVLLSYTPFTQQQQNRSVLAAMIQDLRSHSINQLNRDSHMNPLCYGCVNLSYNE